ncbi:Intercellular adhesion molecule 2 [Heterocephalus glaber]|uniref:Intercellular adhesion molecule 2 n=1 Tax=Heterocephalus glaber TaxID=10181 RepID=G5BDI1_HETGA|nr:Intercellular adhesion molecule 2 [Heterocephalus glaber]
MSSFGCWGLPTALLTLLCCSGSSEVTFEVYVWPERLAVEAIGSRKVNCSTSCVKPESGGLETFLSKHLVDQQPQWQQYLISNISQDAELICYFSCAGKTLTKSLNISVYQPPKQVTLKLQPTRVALGTSFTIECRVAAVEPLESLTLTLLRGQETLHNQTFVGGAPAPHRVAAVEPLESLTLTLLRGQETLHNQTFVGAAPAPQEAATTFISMAQREGGPLNFSCQAELDLRSRGGDIIRSVSEPQVLQVYEPVQDSQMVIIVTVVSVLLFLFVTSILLCFIISQHQRQRRTGTYGVLAAWRRLPRTFRVQPA